MTCLELKLIGFIYAHILINLFLKLSLLIKKIANILILNGIFENSEKWGTFRASFPLPLPVRFSISSDSEIEEN